MKCDKKTMLLYAVTDRAWVGRQSLYEQVECALKGGATCVQVREKKLGDEDFLEEAKQIAALCKRYGVPLFINDNVELVVGPMTGGILLAYEVAKNLGTRFFFTERVNGKMTFKRGFAIKPGTRVLVVEDIVTTGGSVREVLDVVKGEGGVPVGVGLLVDRSGGKVDFGVRTEPLLRLDVETYKPEECPMCKEGTPLTQRGRTGK